MTFRIAIFDGGEWLTRAEGREAESLISGMDAVQVLRHLADGLALGRPIGLADFRAVISTDGEIRYLRASEAAAAQMIKPDEGSRVVLARIELVERAADLVIAKP